MKSIIVDASIVASIFTQKDKTKGILKELEKYSLNDKLFSIRFLQVEVSNALRYFYKDGSQVKDALDLIELMSIQYINYSNELIKSAIEIAYEVNDSVYDAAYHALAISRDFEFVTLDEKYFNKAKDLGNIRLYE